MANSFKYFSDHDKTSTTNTLLESIENDRGAMAGSTPIGWLTSSNNPYYFMEFYTSSFGSIETGHRIFDVTFGRSSNTVLSPGTSTYYDIEKNIYNQFSKLLLGYTTGSTTQKFNLDPEDVTNSKILHNAIFLNFSRGEFKDRIKQGSFNLKLNVGAAGTNAGYFVHLVDSGSSTPPEVRTTRTGYVGKLFVSASSTAGESANININTNNQVQGLLFYEAGVAVVSPYIFSQYSASNANPSGSNANLDSNILGVITSSASIPQISSSNTITGVINNGTIQSLGYSLGKAIVESNYYAITELNSTIYFCRAFNHEFNYSSNPTYLNNSRIVVKGDDPEAQPVSYVTTVGLYSDDNQLLAVAKLSEPIKKTPENELIARVRLDF